MSDTTITVNSAAGASAGQRKNSPSAVAWVESPLQAINAFEYAEKSGVDLTIVPRAGAIQLHRTIWELLANVPGARVTIAESRKVIPIMFFLSHQSWVLGDVFSGQVRALLALTKPRQLVIVDDGSITLHLGHLIGERAPLSRPGQSETLWMRVLGRLATRALVRLSLAGRVVLFTYQDARKAAMHSARATGMVIVRNDFGMLRSKVDRRGASDSALSAGVGPVRTIVLGSAWLVDGLVSEAEYLSWVADAASDRNVLYAPHRRESPGVTRTIEHIAGVDILASAVPIELMLAGRSQAFRIVSLPSSAVDILQLVLRGTGSTITVSGIPELRVAA